MKTKRELILDSVFDMVYEGESMSCITVSEIAKRAGIGKGSVYMHFANKDQVMLEAIKYFFESTMANILEYKIDCGDKFEKILKGFIKEHIGAMRKYSKMFSSTIGTEYFPQVTGDLKEKMSDVMANIRESYKKKIKKIIECGKESGLIKKDPAPFDIIAVTQMFFSSAGHFVNEEVPVITENEDDYVIMVYNMALKMLN